MRRPDLATALRIISKMRVDRVYELVVHPGIVDPVLASCGDAYLHGREAERALIASGDFRRLIEGRGLRLRSFRSES
jgi:predicted glycoside hydrolase/deacetylase ChbG (UPF0249 family)